MSSEKITETIKDTPDKSQDKTFDLYIIDGKAYDLTDWIPIHPGGAIWFARSNGRDISAAVHAYHKNPAFI